MADFNNYAYGTVTVAANGTVVTGTGTNWSGVNARAGDDVTIAGHTVIVNDVTDEFHLTIDPWPYDAVTDAAYKITQRSPLRFVGAVARADLTTLLSTLKAKGLLWYLDPAYTTPDDAKPPIVADDGQGILQIASGKMWVMQGGAWTFVGIQKSYGLPAPWISAKTYAVFEVATLNGTSYVAIAANTNQSPPNATYWQVLASKGDDGATGTPGTNGTNGATGPAPLKPIVAWATATAYVVGPPASFVSQGGSSYQCLIAHTSGTFSTDLAAGKWGLVAQKGQDGTGVGDVVGPASATDTSITGFDGTTGKLLKQLTPEQGRAASGAAINDLSNVSLSASVSSNVLTVSLKDASGNNASASSPIVLGFRSATQSNGAMSSNVITSALSVSTMLVGATLGSSNNTPFRLWVVAFDSGGTTYLALYNASTSSTIFPLNESAPASTVDFVGGGALSAGVFYSQGIAITSKSFRILGYLDWGSGLTSAGTYASVPTVIQVMGPGIRKPGDAVQTVTASYSTNSTTTSTTPVNTGLNVSITPTSAVNLMQIAAFGPLGSTTASVVAHARLARGGTAIGQSTAVFSAGGLFISGVSLFSFDRPGTTLSTNYAVQYWMHSAGTAIWIGGAGDGSVIQVTEVQG